MKISVPVLLAASLLLASPVHSKQHRTATLSGVWAADTSRLPMPPQMRPKSVTITFANMPDGALSTRVEVVDAAGALSYAQGIAPLDGTPAPVEGNLEADTSAATMPAPGVLVMQLSRNGVPGSTRVYTLGADGESMTETAANFGDDGRPAMRIHYFHRVRK